MDDAVAHDDIEAERAPVVLLDRSDDAAANVVIVGGRVGDFAGEACDRLQQVGARDDADELVSRITGRRLTSLVSIALTISSSVASSVTAIGSLS